MCTEIEAKLKVDSLQAITERLTEFGAEFLAEQMQTDYYLDSADTALTKTDSCLRLRQQYTGGEKKIILTYKAAKEKACFKKRQEIELEITDADSAFKLFSALGYVETLVFEKKRQLWRLNDCLIALDQLPLLGYFVEIEGPAEKKIADIQTKLKLADLPHIQKSYAALIDEKIRQLGKTERQVFFKS